MFADKTSLLCFKFKKINEQRHIWVHLKKLFEL